MEQQFLHSRMLYLQLLLIRNIYHLAGAAFSGHRTSAVLVSFKCFVSSILFPACSDPLAFCFACPDPLVFCFARPDPLVFCFACPDPFFCLPACSDPLVFCFARPDPFFCRICAFSLPAPVICFFLPYMHHLIFIFHMCQVFVLSVYFHLQKENAGVHFRYHRTVQQPRVSISFLQRQRLLSQNP